MILCQVVLPMNRFEIYSITFQETLSSHDTLIEAKIELMILKKAIKDGIAPKEKFAIYMVKYS